MTLNQLASVAILAPLTLISVGAIALCIYAKVNGKRAVFVISLVVACISVPISIFLVLLSIFFGSHR